MVSRSIARKHHYVPQGYLAAFTDEGTRHSQFCVLDVLTGGAFKTSPINVAAQRDFNRVDIDGYPPDAVENALASFEGEAVAAIRRVNESRSYPNDVDWNLILNLIALIGVRNPRRRNLFNRSRERAIRAITHWLTSDKRHWERHVALANDAGEKLPDVSYEEVKSFVERGQYDLEFHPQENLRLEFNAIDKVLPLLGQRHWSVLVAPDEGPEFVCSDHPVTLVGKGRHRGPVGYGLRDTEVFFPLGRRVGFYGVYESPLKEVVMCLPRNVGAMNQRVLHSAERQVYSAQEGFVILHEGSLQVVRCKG